MKRICFSQDAWEDYLFWQKTDRKILDKINGLIRSIQSDPYKGPGKPEPLKYDLAGWWSRRIEREHRMVYRVTDEELQIIAFRYHYE
jgi:toxin YoeB